jgi:hypothetical protein
MGRIDARAAHCRNALLVALAGEAREMAERTAYQLVHAVNVADGRPLIEIYECQ